MNKIKLNFYRFDEKITVADLRVSVGVDDTGVTTGAKRASAGLSELTKELIKTAEANDNFVASSAKTGNKLYDIASSALARYKNAISEMKTLMKSDIATPNFKTQAQTNIDRAQLAGLDQMSPSTMTMADTNKVLQMANTVQKQVTTELGRQTKEIQKQIIAEDKLIAQEKEKQGFIQQLSTAMGQLTEQKSGFKGTGILAPIEGESAALTKLETAFTKINATGAKFSTTNKELLNEFNSLGGATSRVKTFLEGYTNAMTRVNAKTEEMGNKFSTTIGKLKQAAITWRIMYGAFQQIWNILANTVDQAAAYEEALNLYTVALGEYAEQGSEWANKISTALYLDPKLVMQYTGALYNLVQGLGVGSKAAYVMGTNLTQLAYDMSSYLNIDVQSAYDKLQSAITGQSRAVASAGIAMQMASLQELAYQLGIKKTVDEMTQAEKTYLRYIQIMRSTSNMQGDLARTIVTPENALRVVRQQFNLLARSIGQVFIPIILKAIPYVMALTQILRELAASLGAKLGYKIQEIDYSSLKSVDTAVEDMNKNISSGVGKTTKGVNSGIKSVKNNVKDLKDSVNSTLASFDDLNVVMSKNKNDGTGGTGGTGGGGVGGIGGIGGGGSILPDLEKFVDGYDMLDGLTDQFSKNIDKARQNLKTFGKVLKTILGLFLAWKLLKHVSNLIKFAQGLRTAWSEGTGLVGILAKLVGRFSEGYTKAGKFAGSGLKAVTAGFRNMLTPLGQVVVTLGTSVGAFLSGKKAMQEWDGTTKGMVGNIAEAAIKIGLFTGAAALFVGSGAAVVTAIAGITGGLIGLKIAMNNYMSEEEKQKAYDKLFDNQGVSLKLLTNDFVNGNNEIIEYTKKISSLKHEMDETDENVEKAKTAFEDLHLAIQGGNKSKETIDNLTASTKAYIKSIDDNADSRVNYTKTALDNLLKEEKISKGTYDVALKSAKEYYKWLTGEQHEYIVRLADLDKKLANGKISQEEYNKKLAELNVEFKNTKPEIEGTVDSFANLNRAAASKIDLSNVETIKDSVLKLKDSYDKTSDSLEEQREVFKASYDANVKEAKIGLGRLMKEYDTTLEGLADKYQEMSDKDKKAYDEFSGTMRDQQALLDTNMSDLESKSETLSATYKDYLGSILAQISASGLEGEEKFKGTVDTIQTELKGLGDVDPSKSMDKMWEKVTNNMLINGEELKGTSVKQFQDLGFTLPAEMAWAFQTEQTKKRKEYEASMQDFLDKSGPNIEKSFSGAGEGYFKAQYSSFNKNITSTTTINGYKTNINKAIKDASKDVEKTCAKSLGEEPAKKAATGFTETYGKDGKKKINSKVNEVMSSTAGDAKSVTDKAGKELGGNLSTSAASGVESKSSFFTKALGANSGLAGKGIQEFKKVNQISSPSKVYKGFGVNIVEGLRDGITSSSSIITKALDSLTKSMQNKMKSVKLSMSFNTDMSGSFNKILDKLERFISKWRTAVNKALSETKKSLNSITTDKKGSVTFTPFSPITVPKFAEGGYPTRGDLFFANENGMPEYITSLGGRTAVVNQDQMVQALTNAIVEGLSGMNTGNNGDVVIYLGNELIYKGMAKYRQRENNRYGTTIA